MDGAGGVQGYDGSVVIDPSSQDAHGFLAVDSNDVGFVRRLDILRTGGVSFY